MSKNNENKLVPRLRFPEFLDLQSWIVKSLGNVADVYQPKTISQSELNDNGYLVYGANGIIGHYNNYNHETSQIAIACRGNSCGTVNFTEPKSWITGNAMVVNVDDFNEVHKKFMFYQLFAADLNYLITGSGQPQITGNIKNHQVVLTTLKEQQKIASCLSSLDDLITAEGKKLEVLKEHKKGLLQNLFPQEGETVPKLRFPEFTNEIWKRKTIDETCEVLNNLRKPLTSNLREKGEYPYYGASGIIDFVKDFIFNERLLLIGEDGAKWGAYEKTAFIAEGKYWVNNHAHVLKPTGVVDTLLENYLVKLDLSPFITGAAPPKLTLGKLKSIPVPIPNSRKEQQKIASCLSSVDELIIAQAQKIEVLQLHKKGLLQGLFPNLNEGNDG